VDVRGGAVGRDADHLDRAAEHRGVPALVGDLAQGVLRAPAPRVLVVDVANHQLHQDDLEPDADAGGARDLVPFPTE
jgi:hypothetical protein